MQRRHRQSGRARSRTTALPQTPHAPGRRGRNGPSSRRAPGRRLDPGCGSAQGHQPSRAARRCSIPVDAGDADRDARPARIRCRRPATWLPRGLRCLVPRSRSPGAGSSQPTEAVGRSRRSADPGLRRHLVEPFGRPRCRRGAETRISPDEPPDPWRTPCRSRPGGRRDPLHLSRAEPSRAEPSRCVRCSQPEKFGVDEAVLRSFRALGAMDRTESVPPSPVDDTACNIPWARTVLFM